MQQKLLEFELQIETTFNWTLCSTLPFMQPGNLSLIALSSSAGDIHFPNFPSTPSAATGIVSRRLDVDITVLLSTLATSLGSVFDSQLQ